MLLDKGHVRDGVERFKSGLGRGSSLLAGAAG